MRGVLSQYTSMRVVCVCVCVYLCSTCTIVRMGKTVQPFTFNAMLSLFSFTHCSAVSFEHIHTHTHTHIHTHTHTYTHTHRIDVLTFISHLPFTHPGAYINSVMHTRFHENTDIYAHTHPALAPSLRPSGVCASCW